MFYPIHYQYVGPNSRDSHGGSTEPQRIGTVEIHTEPGETNLSHQPRTEGWLGTTNDGAAYALGEYETIEEARAAIAAQGWTEPVVDRDAWHDESWIETWTKPAALMQYWDASDWLGELGASDIGVTADATDEQIEEIAEGLEAEANEFRDVDCQHGVELEGTVKYLRELRDKLRADRDD